MTNKIICSIIIVNYKADAHVERLKKALQKTPFTEIIVIDNSRVHRGYGAGCNMGAQQASGEILFFLNPDIEITSQTVLALSDLLQKNENVGLVGPQIKDIHGRTQITCSAVPTPLIAAIEYSFLGKLPFLRWAHAQYRLNNFDHKNSRDVPSISGSCFALRTKDFQKIGGVDENLFLYFEEFDLAIRITDQLKKIVWFCAEESVVHYGQVSTQQTETNTHFLTSRAYWLEKTYGWSGKLVNYWLRFAEKIHG